MNEIGKKIVGLDCIVVQCKPDVNENVEASCAATPWFAAWIRMTAVRTICRLKTEIPKSKRPRGTNA